MTGKGLSTHHGISGPERYIRVIFTLIKTGHNTNTIKPVTVRVTGFSLGTDPNLKVQVRVACKDSGTSQSPDLLAAYDHLPLINKPLIEMKVSACDRRAVLIIAVAHYDLITVKRLIV
jgi:hypothetical protein